MPRGDDLDRMIADLHTAPRRVMGAATSALQGAMRASVELGYKTRTDVNGKPYIPAKDGHLPQMERSGALRASYSYTAHPSASGDASVTARSSVPRDYDEHLRDGTSKMEARQHLPRPGEPVPARWDAAIRPAIAGAVQAEEARR
jgi:hypothetical protein